MAALENQTTPRTPYFHGTLERNCLFLDTTSLRKRCSVLQNYSFLGVPGFVPNRCQTVIVRTLLTPFLHEKT